MAASKFYLNDNVFQSPKHGFFLFLRAENDPAEEHTIIVRDTTDFDRIKRREMAYGNPHGYDFDAAEANITKWALKYG